MVALASTPVPAAPGASSADTVGFRSYAQYLGLLGAAKPADRRRALCTTVAFADGWKLEAEGATDGVGSSVLRISPPGGEPWWYALIPEVEDRATCEVVAYPGSRPWVSCWLSATTTSRANELWQQPTGAEHGGQYQPGGVDVVLGLGTSPVWLRHRGMGGTDLTRAMVAADSFQRLPDHTLRTLHEGFLHGLPFTSFGFGGLFAHLPPPPIDRAWSGTVAVGCEGWDSERGLWVDRFRRQAEEALADALDTLHRLRTHSLAEIPSLSASVTLHLGRIVLESDSGRRTLDAVWEERGTEAPVAGSLSDGSGTVMAFVGVLKGSGGWLISTTVAPAPGAPGRLWSVWSDDSRVAFAVPGEDPPLVRDLNLLPLMQELPPAGRDFAAALAACRRRELRDTALYHQLLSQIGRWMPPVRDPVEVELVREERPGASVPGLLWNELWSRFAVTAEHLERIRLSFERDAEIRRQLDHPPAAAE